MNQRIRFRLLACLGTLAFASSIIFAQLENPPSNFPRIRPDELKRMIDSKATDFLVVSNDPQESFDEGHIPGAVSFPWVDKLRGPINLPRGKTLILYCACSHEEDSSDMAGKLALFGYRNVMVLEGGILKWTELKYPIEKK
jgi:rhodanese-related sulfurtransferase